MAAAGFKNHQLVWIETDASLGLARIVNDSEFSFFQVEFLETGEKRNYTKRNPPLRRLQLHVGQKLWVKNRPAEIAILAIELKNDLYTFDSSEGHFSEDDILRVSTTQDILDLFRQRKFFPAKQFQLRRQAWDLLRLRENHRLKGAVGCRVETLPHQLFVLDAALEMPVIRALLADEVGLGKTIEAGLIFSNLHAQKKLHKVLILAPAALKVQWLTESFRRFNVRFRLDHESLIEDDEFRDFVIASLEEIESNLGGFDLLIVDEAHRLNHDPVYFERLEKIVAQSKHVLFLSATPQVHGDAEFQRLLKILGQSPEGIIAPKIFQSRRSELGIPVYRRLEPAMVSDKHAWLVDFIAQKIADKQKAKVFLIANKADDVVKLWTALRKKFGEHFAVFHENLSLVERDRQAAYFSEPSGAQFLVSSEIGGEGRNFQFCQNMVLVDLPADPLVIEQRIGRLDRLGQKSTVHVWCPILEDSAEEEIFERLRDVYRVFDEPWSGSGLEDTSDSTRSRGIESRIPFDAERARELMQTVATFSKTPIKDFLDQLYDVYGVEVEDFDLARNWKIFASSLMFVESFPGLGKSGERIVTFDRSTALAREDMAFFSIDHPDVVESIEFFLNSTQGRLAFSYGLSGRQAALMLGLFPASQTMSWDCTNHCLVTVDQTLLDVAESPKAGAIPDPVIHAFSQAYEEFLESSDGSGDCDALLVLLPKSPT